MTFLRDDTDVHETSPRDIDVLDVCYARDDGDATLSAIVTAAMLEVYYTLRRVTWWTFVCLETALSVEIFTGRQTGLLGLQLNLEWDV